MHRMNVDIETYSDVDITKAGAYAYAKSPVFEILLIAYKMDDAPVRVIDLTAMNMGYGNHTDARLLARIQKAALQEHYPDFWEALVSPQYQKAAYNANFERTCLTAYFETPMPPKQWRCTAIHAAALGLPASLGAVGEALGLPMDQQKDKAGKRR